MSFEADRGPGAEITEDQRAAGPRRRSMMLWVLGVLVMIAVVPIVLVGYNISKELEADLAANQKELQLNKGALIRDDF